MKLLIEIIPDITLKHFYMFFATRITDFMRYFFITGRNQQMAW